MDDKMAKETKLFDILTTGYYYNYNKNNNDYQDRNSVITKLQEAFLQHTPFICICKQHMHIC